MFGKVKHLFDCKVTKEIEKNNDVRYTYEEIIRLKWSLDNLPTIESRYYVEALINTVDKPFIPSGIFNIMISNRIYIYM